MEKDHLPSFAGLKFLVLILVVALAACSRDSGLPDPDIVQSTVDPGNQVYRLETTGLTEFSYTINLGSTPRDLYYVITNPGTAAVGVPLPVIETVQGGVSRSVSPPEAVIPERSAGSEGLTGPGRALRDRVGVEDPLYYTISSREIGVTSRALNAVDDTVGEEQAFWATKWVDNNGNGQRTQDEYQYVEVNGECIFAQEINGVKLNIWVESDYWNDTALDSENVVNDTKLTSLSTAFLNPDPEKTGEDIYTWLTTIFGVPWGAHSRSDLISGTDNSITIFLTDIDGDGFEFANEKLYVAGYFSAINYYIGIEQSNQRVMFYLDAPAYAYSKDGNWDITNSIQQDQISTLAHEFQHMIMFYQKNILRNADPDIWLNEMSSLMAEDFVSDKLGIPGPRGVDLNLWPTGTAGDNGNDPGRISIFNQYPEESLTVWSDAETGILPDYSAAYSFGAFLGRNYGGAALFKDIVQSAFTDQTAVITTIKKVTGKDVTFSQLLQDWGAAVLLSDQTSESAAVTDRWLNRAGWFSRDGYSLGSINHYYYDYDPYYYFPETLSQEYEYWYDTINQQPASNIYILAASSATGIVAHNFTVGEGVVVTAVVKDASP